MSQEEVDALRELIEKQRVEIKELAEDNMRLLGALEDIFEAARKVLD